MVNVIIKEGTFLHCEAKNSNYTYIDFNDRNQYFEMLNPDGQTAILNINLEPNYPIETVSKQVNDLIKLELTSICIENPGTIGLEELESLLSEIKTLAAFSLYAFFSHINTDRHTQLVKLVKIALESNLHLEHLRLNHCPISNELYDLLIKFAKKGQLKSCELIDHSYQKFPEQEKRLTQALLENSVKSASETPATNPAAQVNLSKPNNIANSVIPS